MAKSRSALLSYYSVADFGYAPEGTLHFPGREALPTGSAGYVRSAGRARMSVLMRDAELPWRDYPAEVLTPTGQVLDVPFSDDLLLLGCRNVLNEWGHQIRIDGKWWRRAGDPSVDARWPVLATLTDGIRLLAASDAEKTDADLLTGVPLVIRGVASSRRFLLANCSDVAHMFEVHPRGKIGPSADAWLDLSNAWETAHQAGESEAEIEASLLAIARRHGAAPRHDYLHSVIAEVKDGRIVAYALTGSLEWIAAHLAQSGVWSAILLDNGGSVGWFFCPRNGQQPALLVGAPNRRDCGTAFLSVETRGFPKATVHNAGTVEME